MVYEELSPSGAAETWAETYWRFSATDPQDADQIEHHIVPDGLVSVQATFFAGQMVALDVCGPDTTAQRVTVPRGLRVAGIRLRPGATFALLGIEPGQVRGRVAPLKTLAEDHVDWVSDALAGAWADDAARHLDAALAARQGPIDAPILAASARILDQWGQVEIAALAQETGLSPRQFRERFGRAAGLSPKAFAQVRRQRAAWIKLVTGEAQSLCDASHAAGYADQAHFAREARDTFNLRPSAVRGHVATIRHRFAWLEGDG